MHVTCHLFYSCMQQQLDLVQQHGTEPQAMSQEGPVQLGDEST